MSRSPLDANAERTVIGAIMLRDGQDAARTLAGIREIIDPDDFLLAQASSAYRAMCALADRGEPCGDAVLIASEIQRQGRLADLAWLADAQAATPTAENARHYARIVRDWSLRRRIAVHAGQLARNAWHGREEPAEGAAALAELAREIQARAGDVADAMPRVGERAWSEIADAFEGRRVRLDPVTGMALMDGFLPSLGLGEMLVVGGRPGSGKSNLAGDLAFGWSRAGHPGLVLTLEDTAEEFARREWAKASGVDGADARAGRLNPVGWTALAEARAATSALPLHVQHLPGARACDLVSRMASAARLGLRFVVVDYLQVVRPSQWRAGAGREQETSTVVAEIKAAATQLGVVLVLLSQLRRIPGEGGEPRPTASDLRNSGMIEAQADAIVLIWRPRRSDYSRTKLILAKHRHGPAGELDLHWLPHTRKAWQPRKDVINGRSDGDDPPF